MATVDYPRGQKTFLFQVGLFLNIITRIVLHINKGRGV